MELIKSTSPKRLNSLFELHYEPKMYFLVGEPYRKFNWLKLRNEWRQKIDQILSFDDIEYVHNFGGENTQQTIWTYIAPHDVIYKKIFYSNPNKNQTEDFKEWKQNIIKSFNK